MLAYDDLVGGDETPLDAACRSVALPALGGMPDASEDAGFYGKSSNARRESKSARNRFVFSHNLAYAFSVSRENIERVFRSFSSCLRDSLVEKF